jgi:hypothetical protein
MPPSSAANRRLLVLCGLIPLPELTQDEVDYLFRQLVEDAPIAAMPGGIEQEVQSTCFQYFRVARVMRSVSGRACRPSSASSHLMACLSESQRWDQSSSSAFRRAST